MPSCFILTAKKPGIGKAGLPQFQGQDGMRRPAVRPVTHRGYKSVEAGITNDEVDLQRLLITSSAKA